MENEQYIISSLKKLRSDLGLSQQDLSEKIGVSKTTLANWETGRQVPPIDKYAQILALSKGEDGLQKFWEITMRDQVINNAGGIGIQNNSHVPQENQNMHENDEMLKLFQRIYTTAKNYDQINFLKASLHQLETQMLQTIQASFK
ncbi:MAG: XRE family transcriptional regulator [Erysipelotrichia bacterium]|nr:XRE family transcriptional regulator [Erysipelotrichia bacterium]